jgi:hypothetical protein
MLHSGNQLLYTYTEAKERGGRTTPPAKLGRTDIDHDVRAQGEPGFMTLGFTDPLSSWMLQAACFGKRHRVSAHQPGPG